MFHGDSLDLPQPPRKTTDRFDDWMFKLWKLVTSIDTTASGTTQDHAKLQNLNSTAYSHPTSDQLGQLTSGGQTSLHSHDADRNRANHSGVQTSATISDFAQAVQALQTTSNGVLEAQIFGP